MQPPLEWHAAPEVSALLAWAAVAVLAGLVVFQLMLIAGRPLGEYAWGGSHRILFGLVGVMPSE
jgi:hypothetical protein